MIAPTGRRAAGAGGLTKAAASIEMEMETSTSRFVMRNIHPAAAKALREFRVAGHRRPGWGRGVGEVVQSGRHGMMSDRERYDIDWSRLTAAEAEIVRTFRAALQEAQEEELARMRRTLHVLELLCDGLAAVNADTRAGWLPELPEDWLRDRRGPPVADMRAGCFKNCPSD